MTSDIRPVEGYVALRLLDGETEEERLRRQANNTGPSQSYNEAIPAVVVAIGPKGPTGVKKGTTVLVRKYARDGLRLDDDVVLVEHYCIAAIVSG